MHQWVLSSQCYWLRETIKTAVHMRRRQPLWSAPCHPRAAQPGKSNASFIYMPSRPPACSVSRGLHSIPDSFDGGSILLCSAAWEGLKWSLLTNHMGMKQQHTQYPKNKIKRETNTNFSKTHVWINKMYYVCTRESCSSLKRKKVSTFFRHRWTLKTLS